MNKYHNKKILFNGNKFDSKKEAKRYSQLKLMERSGLITDLKTQVKYVLQDGFKKNGKTYLPITYIADFVYYDKLTKKIIIEDTKGYRTDIYKIKKKLFEYRYKELEIVEL